jgi:hypothetical protein
MFPLGSRVRLLHDAVGVPKGTEGEIVGFYHRDESTYVVKFAAGNRELLAEDLEPLAYEPQEEPLSSD